MSKEIVSSALYTVVSESCSKLSHCRIKAVRSNHELVKMVCRRVPARGGGLYWLSSVVHLADVFVWNSIDFDCIPIK